MATKMQIERITTSQEPFITTTTSRPGAQAALALAATTRGTIAPNPQRPRQGAMEAMGYGHADHRRQPSHLPSQCICRPNIAAERGDIGGLSKQIDVDKRLEIVKDVARLLFMVVLRY